MKDQKIEIGKRISSARKKKKLTQEKLAEMVELSPKHISSVERGKTNLSVKNLISICEALDVSIDYVVTGSNYNLSDSPFPKSVAELFSSDDASEIDLLLEYIRLYEKIRKK